MAKIRDSGVPEQALWESFFDPEAILDAFGAQMIEGDCLELGCGYGTFALAAARRTQGTVYALDIDPAMVACTRARAQAAGLRNLIAWERDFVSTGTGLPDNSVAFAMLFNILHGESPIELLAEARRTLRPGGRLALMHWLSDRATPRGPPLALRPSAEACLRWGEQAGLRTLGPLELAGAPWHFGVLLERPATSADRPADTA